MTNKTKAVIAIITGSVLGGAVSSVIKLTIKDIPPFAFSFIRFLIASICLLPFFLKSKTRFDNHFKQLVLLSVLPTLNIALFVIGVKTTTASIAQMLYAGVPILVGVLGYFLFGYRLSLRKWFFISIGIFGVFFVIFLPYFQKNLPFTGDVKGNLLIILGVFSWSIYAVYSKQFQKKYSPLIITSFFFFVAAVVFFLLTLFEFSPENIWWNNLKLSSVFSILYISIFATVAVYILNQYAFKYADAVLGSLSLYLVPIFAYFSAYFLLGEKLTPGLIIGTILVFASVALTSYSK